MARPETLVAGNCYFSVGFGDQDLLLPMIDTLVYVGQEDDSENGRMWLFKQPVSPSALDEVGSPEPPTMVAFSDNQLHEIVDFDGLVERLREIGINHPLKSATKVAAEPATTEEFASIAGELSRFLDDPEFVSVTITIRFTDDGLSLSRRDVGYDMGFFTHHRRDPNQDNKILSLFGSIGVQPAVDYLCNGGRTRVLNFPVSSERDSIVDLCRRVFTQVYAMRRGDLLNYRFLSKSEIAKHRQSHGEGG
jgi:hypothetical protein